MGYLYIAATIFFTVYGQLILKWQMNQPHIQLTSGHEHIVFLLNKLLDPFVLSGLFSAFIASLFWMLAIERLPLSRAYPWMSLSFICVFILAIIWFHEAWTLPKVVGLLLVIVGLIVFSHGA